MNTTVSNLCKGGYVKLTPAAKEGRRKILELTDKGKEYARRTVAMVMQAERPAFVQFGEEKAKMFAQLLEEFAALLKAEIGKGVLTTQQAGLTN